MNVRGVPWPAAAVCLVPLSFPVAQLLPTGLPVPVVQAMTVASITLAIMTLVAHGQVAARGRVLSRSPMVAVLGLVVLAALVSTIAGVDPGRSTRLASDYLLGFLLTVVTILAAGGRRGTRFVTGCLCLVGGGVCLQGIATATSFEPHYGGALVENRATGIFGQPNELGAFAALTLILGLALFFSAGRREPMRFLAAACAVAGLAAVAISLSRGAWVGLALGLAVFVVLAPSVRRVVVSTALSAVLLAGLLLFAWPHQSLLSVLGERALSVVDGQRNPFDFRPQIWTEGLRQFEDHPWLGVGPGGFELLAHHSPSEVTAVAPDHAHSLAVTVAAEQGTIGLLAMCAAVGVTAYALSRAHRRDRVRRRRSRSGPEHTAASADQTMRAGVAAALATVLGQGLLDYPLRNAVLASSVWLCLGLLAAQTSTRAFVQPPGSAARSSPGPSGSPPPPAVPIPRWASSRRTLGEQMNDELIRHRAGLARPPRRRVVAAILPAAAFLAAAMGGIQAWPSSYVATSVVSFAPRPPTMMPADTVQLMAQKYAVIATSSPLVDAVGRAIGVGPDELSPSLSAAISPGSANLEISVVRRDRAQAVAAANAAAALVVERAGDDALTVADITAPAGGSDVVSKPPRSLLRVVSVVAAVVLGVVGWMLLSGRTRRRPDDATWRRPGDEPSLPVGRAAPRAEAVEVGRDSRRERDS